MEAAAEESDNMANWKVVCLCALSGGVPRRSFWVAVIVGTILNLNNQGDALLAAAPINWAKVALTFLVPYAVSTYGAVSYRLGTMGLVSIDEG